jgi:hypothetical protein
MRVAVQLSLIRSSPDHPSLNRGRPTIIWGQSEKSEFAMKSAFSGDTSAAKLAAKWVLSSAKNPSIGGRIGGTDAPGGGSLISEATETSPNVFGWWAVGDSGCSYYPGPH